MRKLLAYGLCTLVLSVACFASAGQRTPVLRDPGDAWPWGAELPFPWKGIQGVWKSSVEGKELYFSFKTLRSVSGVKQLQITAYSENCALIARGAGFEEEERIINAMMVYRNGRSFNMTVHVFRQADIRNLKNPDYVEVPGAKTVTVMTITSLSGKEEPKTHQLHKKSSNPSSLCPQLLNTELYEY